MIFFRVRLLLAALTLCLCPLWANAQSVASGKTQIISDINGKAVFPLRRDGARAKAFFFIVRDCPIANAYAPEINRIVADYAAKGVAFYLVYVDTDAPTAELQRHYWEYGYRCPALKDSDGVLRPTMESAKNAGSRCAAGGRAYRVSGAH